MQPFVEAVARFQEQFGQSQGTLYVIGLVLATVLFAYFVGCFNGSVIVSKYILHNDVRNHGSGNAGLTNFHRVFGGPLTLVVLLTDVAKAVLAVLIGGLLFGLVLGGGDHYMVIQGRYLAGMCCILGHIFPCFFHFQGGKGILSGGTMAIVVDWRVAIVVWGCFIILFLITKWVSLGSCAAAAAYPVATVFLHRNVLCIICALVCGVLIVWKHRGNLQRMVRGEEPKFSLHHKKEVS